MLQSMKDLFPLTREVSYLDTAAEGLPPLSSETALIAYWCEKSRGTPGRARLFETQRETEQAAAKLVDTSAENVVLLANSSEALNLLANSIDWKVGRRGAHQRSRVSVECVGVAAFEADRGSRQGHPD